jgi:allantoicase
VRLAARGVLHRVEIDTDHFKGNAPGSAMLETIDAPKELKSMDAPGGSWQTALPQIPLQPHARHRFDAPGGRGAVTHARLSIYPDGGIARLRLFGIVA